MRIFRKTLAASIVAAISLSACSKPADPSDSATETQKTDFAFESRPFGDFSKTSYVEKIGRAVAASTVTVASQWIGRIESVPFKEGASVSKGQSLARLADTVANYSLRYEQANNLLASSEANEESTRISVDKAVTDAETALERAKIEYERTLADSEQQLAKAERDSSKTSLALSGSDSQSAIAKAELDLSNLRSSNATTIANYDPTYRISVNDLKKLAWQVSFDADKLIGATEANRGYNDAFEIYLSAKDSSALAAATNAYPAAAGVVAFLETKSSVSITETNALSEFDELAAQYPTVRNLLDATIRALESSVPSTHFPQSAIDGHLATFNAYKSSLSALESAFVSFRNSAKSFLANYRNNEASAMAALEVQRKNLESGNYDASVGYERAKIAVAASVENARISLVSAENALRNARESRDATLKKLAVARSDAELQVRQAASDLAKLSVVSPISGTVVRVLAQVGQDVSAGTPIAEIASRAPEILLDVDAGIANSLEVGTEVSAVASDGKAFSGTVTGVAKAAGASLLYAVRISLSEAPALLGDAVTVRIPVPSEFPLVPIDAVAILSEQAGELTAFSGGTFVPLPVKMGKLSGEFAEIVSEIPSDTEIVVSDVTNYDPKVHAPSKKAPDALR